MKAALIQMTASDDPAQNIAQITPMLRAAAGQGASLIATPEVTNCVSLSRARQQAVLRPEAEDRMLAALRDQAAKLGVWIAVGSLALKTDGARFANRSFVIGPDGDIRARYDKIHMFDVTLSDHESYQESKGFRPGDRAVTCDTPLGRLGLSICYDLRFPHLYRALAQAGATVLMIPAAFAPATGAAHWEPLLRARAIECGAYVLAAAQTGTHPAQDGAERRTWGHSIAVSPGGDVLADAGTEPGLTLIDIDPEAPAQARARIPSLTHDQTFRGPQ